MPSRTRTTVSSATELSLGIPSTHSQQRRKRKVARNAAELSLDKEPSYISDIWRSLSGRYSFAGALGAGKNGIAYRITHRTTLVSFCLKTVNPDAPDRERAVDSLLKEIEILRTLKHQCLPLLVDSDSNGPKPYYVCAYHPGMTLYAYTRLDPPRPFTFDDSFRILSSLVDVLFYLHGKGFSHCDLHSKNILVSESIANDGVFVIDFGSGHYRSDTTAQTANRGNITFKALDADIPAKGNVPRTQANPSFYAADFKALADLISQWDTILFSDASAKQRESLIEFQQYLGEGKVEMHIARSMLRRIANPIYKFRIFEARFESKRRARRSIPLPITGDVRVGDGHFGIINSSSFQRLRLLKQLSFCDWIFPGAMHSRFEHSLGVFETIHRSLKYLSHDKVFRDAYSVDMLHCVALVGLLHDLGHYPFAHSIEQYAAVRFSDVKEIRRAVSHTARTLTLINDEPLASAINGLAGHNAVTLLASILKKERQALSGLIDGPIDCDKIDYLKRDAHHCGVAFGNGLDASALLRNYVCLKTSNGEISLAIREEALSTLEGFALLQDQMLSGVYWHPQVRGLHAGFHYALDLLTTPDAGDTTDAASIQAARGEELVNLVRAIQGHSSEADAVKCVLLPALEKKHLSNIERSVATQMLRTHIIPDFDAVYYPIATFHSSDSPQKHGLTMNVYSYIVTDAPLTDRPFGRIDLGALDCLKVAFHEACEAQGITVGDGELLVDIPMGKSSHSTVYVVRPDGDAYPLEEVTHLKDTLLASPAVHSAPIRVYVRRDVADAVSGKRSVVISTATAKFEELIAVERKKRR